MSRKHVIRELSAYYHNELPSKLSRDVADHLQRCPRCRREFEEIKQGASWAEVLPKLTAPTSLWTEITAARHAQTRANVPYLLPFAQAAGRQRLAAIAIAILFVIGLGTIWYFKRGPQTNPQVADGQSTDRVPQDGVRSPAGPADPAKSGQPAKEERIETARFPEQSNPGREGLHINTPLPMWQVARLAGAPRVGTNSITDTGRLAVGEWLETDASSRAKIVVADIGQVEIEPNSRVLLVATRATEHRLALARGRMQAKIDAPPRLFIVDTPSAVAVDLGCAYTLEVDDSGRSILHVTSGWVALERKGRESIVPAGAVCVTKPGVGLGTPYSVDTSPAFSAALAKFDFQNGGAAALDTILKEAGAFDTLTLWHLLSRVSPAERGRVYDRLAVYLAPPAGVTREGVLRSNRKMLALWKEALIESWFE